MLKAADIFKRRNPRRSSDYTTALLVALILAVTNVIYTGYWAGHTEGVRESGGMLADLPYTLEGLHIVISVCLGLCVIGLWLRSIGGLITSTLALVSVLIIYAYWYFLTLRYLHDLQENIVLYRRVQQQVGLFLGATNWDFAVLAISAVLLFWHVPKIATLFVAKKNRQIY